MNRITFTCRVITPMFSGNALVAGVEVRSSAVKGAIRYWWRAMQNDVSIASLRDSEANIFGGTIPETLKSKVNVLVRELDVSKSKNQFNNELIYDHKIKYDGTEVNRPVDVMKYISYGMSDKNRYYITEGSTFEIELVFNSSLTDHQQLSIVKALYCVSLIGGMGAKSRNGFGRFTITKRSDNVEHFGLIELLKEFVISPSPQKSYTAFSDAVKLLKANSSNGVNDGQKQLFELGHAYKIAKSKVDVCEHDVTNRQYIALPVNDSDFKKKLERHAKTYFFTVVEESDTLIGYIVFLPYNFLEDNNLNDNNGNELYSSVTIEKLQLAYIHANTAFINLLKQNFTEVAL